MGGISKILVPPFETFNSDIFVAHLFKKDLKRCTVFLLGCKLKAENQSFQRLKTAQSTDLFLPIMKSDANLTRQRIIIFEMKLLRPLVGHQKSLHSSKTPWQRSGCQGQSETLHFKQKVCSAVIILSSITGKVTAIWTSNSWTLS